MSCGGLSGQVSIYKTPLVDKHCKTIRLGEKGQFKKIMLASFPGSGNTWTRYVIERATGFFTGAVANDSSLFNGGFLGEFENQNAGTTILVKVIYSIGSRKRQRKAGRKIHSWFSEFRHTETSKNRTAQFY
jgi:hypothetical protein